MKMLTIQNNNIVGVDYCLAFLLLHVTSFERHISVHNN